MSSEKKDKDKSVILALALLFGAIAFLSMYFTPEGKGRSASSQKLDAATILKSEAYERSVNWNLKATNEDIATQQKKIEIENMKHLNRVHVKDARTPFESDQSLTLEGGQQEAEIANLLGRGEKKRNGPPSPDDLIQRELYNQQQMQEYNQAYREEYARQFVENARRGGFKVTLSADLTKVISVVPIRAPSQSFELFKGSNSSSR